MEPITFHKIYQFRQAVKEVSFIFGHKMPVLEFTGTVKVHGTNASVRVKDNGEQFPQSKNNILTAYEDNYGFAAWHSTKLEAFRGLHTLLGGGDLVIYGEWAGKGIQKGVAVSELDKFFYIFAVKKLIGEDHIWLNNYPTLDVFHDDILDSRQVMELKFEIDFNSPAESTNELIEITNQVEKKCPVGEYFGVDGVGEGVVWTYINEDGEMIQFKVKGEKHSSSKVKKLASVDTEKVRSVNEFVNYAVTESRLNQALKEACNGEPDRKNLGKFIKWVFTDINAEEQDTLESNRLTMKDVGGPLSKAAKSWFFDKEQEGDDFIEG